MWGFQKGPPKSNYDDIDDIDDNKPFISFYSLLTSTGEEHYFIIVVDRGNSQEIDLVIGPTYHQLIRLLS